MTVRDGSGPARFRPITAARAWRLLQFVPLVTQQRAGHNIFTITLY